MSNHVERMQVELKELKVKMDALEAFIETSPIFPSLSFDEKADMVDQLQGMGEYHFFLNKRLKRATK